MFAHLLCDPAEGISPFDDDSEGPIGTSKSEKHDARRTSDIVVFEEAEDGVGI